ncbi:protein ACCELERATED CELL DEATH 6-like [Cajanus cajan]|uniref:protein ACCELERATED CELL DEATH 6-like n=1 Tax=Cajanus cajan TaxID=3821 RepID=UPI0010FBA93F|nr:protein ACCELERATED CELL DEATH 6-like [Cajanus cajan]
MSTNSDDIEKNYSGVEEPSTSRNEIDESETQNSEPTDDIEKNYSGVEEPSTSSNEIDESETQNSEPTDEIQGRDLCLSKKTSDLIKHHKPIPDECVLQKSPLGNTVLHVAARYQNDDLVEKITKNASHLLHAKNKNGDTALHVAARYGHVSTLRKLFDACLSNLPFPYSENPKEAVEETLVRNKQGNTFFHEALLNGHAPKDVRSMLRSKETSIRVGFTELVERVALFRTNNDGQCVLYLAIEGGYKEFVMNALEKLRSQHSALDELIQNHQELVEIISKDIEPAAPPPLPPQFRENEDSL